MSLSPPEYIRHMLDEIDYILNRISNMDYESFVHDETLKRAFVRSVEVSDITFFDEAYRHKEEK